MPTREPLTPDDRRVIARIKRVHADEHALLRDYRRLPRPVQRDIRTIVRSAVTGDERKRL